MGIPRTDNPKVIEHIEAQGFQRNMYSCGCILAKDDTIMLCQWHDGYDEGLAEAAFDQRLEGTMGAKTPATSRNTVAPNNTEWVWTMGTDGKLTASPLAGGKSQLAGKNFYDADKAEEFITRYQQHRIVAAEQGQVPHPPCPRCPYMMLADGHGGWVCTKCGSTIAAAEQETP